MVPLIVVGGAVFVAVSLVTLLVLRYMDMVEFLEEDAGWHRVWHERIWEPEDEDRGNGRDQ